MRRTNARIQAAISFYDSLAINDPDDPAYARKRAAACALLDTRAQREALIDSVPPAFRALVLHNLTRHLAHQLAAARTREQADQLIAQIPPAIVDSVKSLARNHRIVRRRLGEPL